MIISYLGPEGSFSHAAARELQSRLDLSRLDNAATLLAASNIESVIRGVVNSKADAIVGLVPYYNFLEGLVQEHLDLIFEFRLKIIGLIRLPIIFSAGTFDDPPTAASEVFSHPKALSQVSDFIQANFKNAVVTPVSSTSEAAQQVGTLKRGVAIASDDALKKFGVPVFAHNVGNLRHGKNNFTDFFVVQTADAGSQVELGIANHAMIAITPLVDRPGLLAELLGQFHFYGLNISKIHSRPAIDLVEGTQEPQMFYLEVNCTPTAEPLLRCAEAIRYRFSGDKSAIEAVQIMGGFKV